MNSTLPGPLCRLPLLTLVAGAVIALFAGCAKTEGDQGLGAVKLRYATPYSPAHPFSRGDARWIAYVERASAGRLQIEPYWGGSLMDESDSVRELGAGVADISYVVPIYQRAGAHFIRGQTPFYDGATDMHLQNRVALTLWEEFPQLSAELASVRPLIVTGGSFLDVMTREKPVRSLDDLKGLRLRAPAEITLVLEQLGVDAEFMPMGEVYTALAKGTIDGVIAPVDTLKAMRFAEVIKYCTLVSIARGAYYSRAMNRDSWQRLSPELQKIIDASIPVWSEAVIDELTTAQAAGIKLAHERNVEFIRLAPEDMTRLRKVYGEMAQHSAEILERRGLPGLAAYERAQAVIRETNGGEKAVRDSVPGAG
jgi:TRAP-type C4-dicarboxylate transport system substrate-binding protein